MWQRVSGCTRRRRSTRPTVLYNIDPVVFTAVCWFKASAAEHELSLFDQLLIRLRKDDPNAIVLRKLVLELPGSTREVVEVALWEEKHVAGAGLRGEGFAYPAKIGSARCALRAFLCTRESPSQS